MKRLITFLIIILFSINSTATTCNKPVSYLQEGSIAPCTGYLFSPEQEKAVRADSDHIEFLTKINDKLEKLNNVQESIIKTKEDRIANFEKQNQSLASENARLDNIWYKVLYFGLGALTTTLIIKVYER